MNYLSHYYMAPVERLSDGVYCLGLIYPDFNPRWRRGHPIQRMQDACEHHEDLDERFHALPWFSQAVDALVKNLGFEGLRHVFLCHAAVEIALDYFVCQAVRDTRLIDTVKTALDPLDVINHANSEMRLFDTIDAIKAGRLESYGTRQGGRDALARAQDLARTYGEIDVDLTKVYAAAWLVARDNHEATFEALGKPL